MSAPTTQGILGKGLTLSYSPDDTAYTTVAHITDAKPPEVTAGKVETPTYADDFITKIPGYKDSGDVEFQILYDQASTVTLYGLLDNVVRWWKITLNDTHVWKFAGFVCGFGTATPMKDKVTNTIKICVTAQPTFT